MQGNGTVFRPICSCWCLIADAQVTGVYSNIWIRSVRAFTAALMSTGGAGFEITTPVCVEVKMSDNRIWIYPYNMTSEGAKLLAQKLDCLRIKTEGSDFRGKAGQFVLGWGAGTGVYNPSRTGAATLLNPPKLIDIAINKIKFFDQMDGPDGPRTPYYTTNPKMAKVWLDGGNTIVAREQVEGAKGNGIKVINNPLDFIHAPLYTVRVENPVAEYRVYMWQDEVVDIRIKRGKYRRDGMLVGDDVEFIIMDDMNDAPADVWTQAKKAARKLPLATQGLDVIWDGHKAYVLESNTAPYLGIQTANKYAARIKQFLDKEAA